MASGTASTVSTSARLIKAGLKAGPDTDDVVIASSGQTMSLHVRDRSPERIGAVVALPAEATMGGRDIQSPGKPGGSGRAGRGTDAGTFALELVHIANTERGPDIVFTFPWSSAKSPSGVHGTDYVDAATTGPLTGTAGNHGSMSPWTVRNTFLAWGADFKRAGPCARHRATSTWRRRCWR